MKIDQDLRAVINAAAKAQPDTGWRERAVTIAKAVAAFLKRRPAMTRKVNALIAKSKSLREQQEAVDAQIKKILHPLGLGVRDYEVVGDFSDWIDDKEADRFIAAGGILPPPFKGKWKAEKLITELAAASPKKRNAILKQYGIDWS